MRRLDRRLQGLDSHGKMVDLRTVLFAARMRGRLHHCDRSCCIFVRAFLLEVAVTSSMRLGMKVPRLLHYNGSIGGFRGRVGNAPCG